MKLTEYIAITLNEKTCLSVCRRRQCPTERGDLLSKVVRMHRLGLCSTNKKSQFLPSVRPGIKKHEFQANYDRRSFQTLSEIIESQQEELHRAQAEERRRQDQQLLQGQLLQQNSELREAHHKSLNEMEELKKFQSSTFDTIARRRLVEDQDTILELSGRIQELQSEINCLNDSKDFQDAESVRSGYSHVTSRPVSFHLIQFLVETLSRSIGMPSRKEGPPSIWDTHGFSGNVFANPVASLSAPYPHELHQWNSSSEEPLNSSTLEKVKGKNKIKIRDASLDRQPKIQSSSVEETLQRIMGQTNNDCRFQIFISTNSLQEDKVQD